MKQITFNAPANIGEKVYTIERGMVTDNLHIEVKTVTGFVVSANKVDVRVLSACGKIQYYVPPHYFRPRRTRRRQCPNISRNTEANNGLAI